MGRQRFRRGGRRSKGGHGGFGNSGFGPGGFGQGPAHYQGGGGGNYSNTPYGGYGGGGYGSDYGAPPPGGPGPGYGGYPNPNAPQEHYQGYDPTAGYGDPGLWGAPDGVNPMQQNGPREMDRGDMERGDMDRGEMDRGMGGADDGDSEDHDSHDGGSDMGGHAEDRELDPQRPPQRGPQPQRPKVPGSPYQQNAPGQQNYNYGQPQRGPWNPQNPPPNPQQQNAPPQGAPPGYPPQNYPPQNYPKPGYPPPPYPPQNYQNPAGYPPQSYQSQNYPPQAPPSNYNNPPQQQPGQGFGPQDNYDPQYGGGGGGRGGRFNRYPRGQQGPPGQGRFAPTPGLSVEESTVQGIVELQKDGPAYLRFLRNDMLPGADDVFVSPHLVRRYDLRDGSLVEGPIEPPRRPGQKPGLADVTKVDGMTPDEAAKLPRFSELTVIDPDFHYELGDADDPSLRVLDLLCPVGRGQRGLIVAPPRTGKTVFLHKVAQAMERLYPDVHLMVLLVDERPEEGTMWKRLLVKGDVFLSTLDQGTKHHVALSEAVFRRATRLVECKKDVMLLLDSITRMSRAFNAETGNSGRILTGGIDSRTMEKPKRMFGAARNTEGAGALTILGTTLVDTGSKMDQVIFEEFKGTGNMELVLSRPLADRRIFPAFDIGLSGTRKEEKLISPAKLRRIVTLRRVLQKMKPIEAMEQLLLKLQRTPNNDEFLRQFELSGADS